jgi:hypothetical protein
MKATCIARDNRVVLTESQVIEIYLKKSSLQDQNRTKNQKFQSQSRLVAERYGVSPKTIRDIWDQKTWIRTTLHLRNDKSRANEFPVIRKLSDKHPSRKTTIGSFPEHGIKRTTSTPQRHASGNPYLAELFPESFGIDVNDMKTEERPSTLFQNATQPHFVVSIFHTPAPSYSTCTVASGRNGPVFPQEAAISSSGTFGRTSAAPHCPSNLVDAIEALARQQGPAAKWALLDCVQQQAVEDPFHSDWPHW